MVDGAFGSYQVAGRVGVGATATVWKAVESVSGRDVALKVLDDALIGRDDFLERFRAEARVLATLDHPNIVRIYDFVEEADGAWLVEEWIEGASLEAVIAQGRLTPEQALGVLRGALLGLVHAHGAGIVHGDVRPANVLVESSGTSKLVDFGLATPFDARREGTGGALVGTPGYAAPEQWRSPAIGPRTDVYSAGVVLHEMLSGTRAFAGGSPSSILAAQLAGTVPAVPRIGERLNDLLHRAMAADPAARPTDAAAFLADLEEAAADRYGPAWLSASSLAGVAAVAAIGAGTVGAAASTGAGAHAAATEQVVEVGGETASRSTSNATKARRVARRTPKKSLVAGGAAAVAVTVAAVVALAARPAHAEPDLSGRWTVTFKITDSQSAGLEVGETVDNAWRVTRRCDGGSCTYRLALPAGEGVRSGTLRKVSDHYRGTVTTLQDCLDQNGKVLQKATGRSTDRVDIRVTRSLEGRAVAFSGHFVEDFEVTVDDPKCEIRPDLHQEATVTGKRP